MRSARCLKHHLPSLPPPRTPAETFPSGRSRALPHQQTTSLHQPGLRRRRPSSRTRLAAAPLPPRCPQGRLPGRCLHRGAATAPQQPPRRPGRKPPPSPTPTPDAVGGTRHSQSEPTSPVGIGCAGERAGLGRCGPRAGGAATGEAPAVQVAPAPRWVLRGETGGAGRVGQPLSGHQSRPRLQVGAPSCVLHWARGRSGVGTQFAKEPCSFLPSSWGHFNQQ